MTDVGCRVTEVGESLNGVFFISLFIIHYSTFKLKFFYTIILTLTFFRCLSEWRF